MTSKNSNKQAELPEAHLSAGDCAGQQVTSQDYLPGGAIYKEMIQGMLGGNPRRRDKLSVSQWVEEWDYKQQLTGNDVIKEVQGEKAKF